MTIHKVVRYATSAGASKADARARATADTTGTWGAPPGRAEVAAAGRPTGADQIDRLADV
jgi:hypothetical protein